MPPGIVRTLVKGTRANAVRSCTDWRMSVLSTTDARPSRLRRPIPSISHELGPRRRAVTSTCVSRTTRRSVTSTGVGASVRSPTETACGA